MPTWKKMTEFGGRRVDVNMDAVAYMMSYDEGTTNLIFLAGKGDSFLELRVMGYITELQDGAGARGPRGTVKNRVTVGRNKRSALRRKE
jgi:hypothetical protein